MPTVTVELLNIAGTEAAVGLVGGHTVVVDRPEGRAGGMNLGFNGSQLLALAIGGCFCNDLRYAAHEMDVKLTSISVSVALEMEGEPLIGRGARMTVSCETEDGSDPGPIIARARAVSMVSNTLRQGMPVDIEAAANGG